MWFRRYHIFFESNQEKIPSMHTYSWVGWPMRWHHVVGCVHLILHARVDVLNWNWYTELQLAVQGSCNWPIQPECKWPATKVAICVQQKLQSVEGISCNWYTNGAATSHLEQSQLAYPTGMQPAWADTQNRVPAIKIIQSSCPLWGSSSCWNLLCLNMIEWSHLLAGASYIRRRWLCMLERSDCHGNGDDQDQWI